MDRPDAVLNSGESIRDQVCRYKYHYCIVGVLVRAISAMPLVYSVGLTEAGSYTTSTIAEWQVILHAKLHPARSRALSVVT